MKENLYEFNQTQTQMIQILYLSCWVETTRYQKSNVLGVRFGKRALTMVKNYYPNTKIHIFDTINPYELPTIEVTYNECLARSYDLANFIGHQTQPYVDIIEDVRILFTFELLKNTHKIYQKYCQEKSDAQKHYLSEGIKDYIRSEQEFLAQFERNEQIQEIRQLQSQESRIQKDLCDQIMNTQKYSLSIGKIALVVAIFLFVGFLIGKHQEPKKGNSFSNLLYPEKARKHETKNKNNDGHKKIESKTKQRKVIEENLKQKKNHKSQRNHQS